MTPDAVGGDAMHVPAAAVLALSVVLLHRRYPAAMLRAYAAQSAVLALAAAWQGAAHGAPQLYLVAAVALAKAVLAPRVLRPVGPRRLRAPRRAPSSPWGHGTASPSSPVAQRSIPKGSRGGPHGRNAISPEEALGTTFAVPPYGTDRTGVSAPPKAPDATAAERPHEAAKERSSAGGPRDRLRGPALRDGSPRDGAEGRPMASRGDRRAISRGLLRRVFAPPRDEPPRDGSSGATPLRRLDADRAAGPATVGLAPLALGAGLVALAAAAASVAVPPPARVGAVLALSVSLLGLLVAATRRDAPSRAVGLLSSENGVVLALVGAPGLPLAAGLGAASLALAACAAFGACAPDAAPAADAEHPGADTGRPGADRGPR